MRAHTKVIALLMAIALVNVSLWLMCLSAFSVSPTIAFLLSFECFILFLDTTQTLLKYAIHLADLFSNHSLEARSVIMYYTEFITELLIQLATFFYFVVILVSFFFFIFFFFSSFNFFFLFSFFLFLSLFFCSSVMELLTT